MDIPSASWLVKRRTTPLTYGFRDNHSGIRQWGGSDRGRTTEFKDEEGIRESGQGWRYIDSLCKLSLDFRRGKGKAGIGLIMNDGHADGAVVMLFTIVVVMECLGHKGEEE